MDMYDCVIETLCAHGGKMSREGLEAAVMARKDEFAAGDRFFDGAISNLVRQYKLYVSPGWMKPSWVRMAGAPVDNRSLRLRLETYSRRGETFYRAVIQRLKNGKWEFLAVTSSRDVYRSREELLADLGPLLENGLFVDPRIKLED